MEFAEHVSHLLDEGRRLSASARRAGPDAAVPSCPGWTVTDLLTHTGGVHRWAALIVGEGRAEFPTREERAACGHVPAGADVADWFDEGLDPVADALLGAAPGTALVTLFPGRGGREFWARRMVHETLVHRLDAELATDDALGAVDPALAADGIAELMEFLPARVGGRGHLRADPPRTLLVAADEGPAFTVRLAPDGPRADAGVAAGAGAGGDAVGAAPDLTLRGPAAALHPVLWNRAPWTAVTVEPGADAEAATALEEQWRQEARI